MLFSTQTYPKVLEDINTELMDSSQILKSTRCTWGPFPDLPLTAGVICLMTRTKFSPPVERDSSLSQSIICVPICIRITSFIYFNFQTLLYPLDLLNHKPWGLKLGNTYEQHEPQRILKPSKVWEPLDKKRYSPGCLPALLFCASLKCGMKVYHLLRCWQLREKPVNCDTRGIHESPVEFQKEQPASPIPLFGEMVSWPGWDVLFNNLEGGVKIPPHPFPQAKMQIWNSLCMPLQGGSTADEGPRACSNRP